MRGLLISPFALCSVNSRVRYIRGHGRIVRARSINFTVCVMLGQFEGALYSRARYIRGRGRIVRAWSINFTVCVMRVLFEGAVYSEGANYSRKYGIYFVLFVL